MAETVDERSMSDEWILLRDVRAFVAQHCGGSDRAAENLILEYAANGHFKSYRYHQAGSNDPAARGIPPRLWGFTSPLLGRCVFVDFTDSAVAWMRGKPGNYGLMSLIEDKLEETGRLPPYDYYQITLVRLLRSEVLTMLQAAGLLGAPLTAGAAQDPALAAPEKPPSKEAKLSRKGWLERHYPLDKAAGLTVRYDTITKASEAIHEEMRGDPSVEPYTSPRQIEPYLAPDLARTPGETTIPS